MTRFLFIFWGGTLLCLPSGLDAQETTDSIRKAHYDALFMGLLGCPMPLPAKSGRGKVTPPPYPAQKYLHRLAESLVNEGGFRLSIAAAALGKKNDPLSQVEKAFRQLNYLRQQQNNEEPQDLSPSPTDISASTPDALLASVVCALAYAKPSADGLRAAGQAAWLCDDTLEAAAYGRIAYALAAGCVSRKASRKDLFYFAARQAPSPALAKKMRQLHDAEWTDLPAETTLRGRLARVIYIWERAHSFRRAMQEGRRWLQHPASRRLLRGLSAAYFGRRVLPESWLVQELCLQEKTKLLARHYDLAKEGILLSVAARKKNAPNYSYQKTTRTLIPTTNQPPLALAKKKPRKVGKKKTTPEEPLPDSQTPTKQWQSAISFHPLPLPFIPQQPKKTFRD